MRRTQVFFIFANNSRSNQNKKTRGHSFVDIGKQESCAKSRQKIFHAMVVGVRRSLQFFRQKTWFIENSRALSKSLWEFFHQIIKKISP